MSVNKKSCDDEGDLYTVLKIRLYQDVDQCGRRDHPLIISEIHPYMLRIYLEVCTLRAAVYDDSSSSSHRAIIIGGVSR